MKKVFIAAALFAALGLNAAYAETPEVANEQVSATTQQDEFTAIEADMLPQPVKDAIAGKYSDMTVKAAFVKESEGVKIYKVIFDNAENESTELLFSETGEVIPA